MKLPKFARPRPTSSSLPSSSMHPASCNSPSQASHYLCFKSSRTKQALIDSNTSNSSPAASTSCHPLDTAVTISEATQNVGGDAGTASPHNATHHDASLQQLPSNDMHELRQVFAQFDANHDGKISIDELCTVLQSLGIDTTREDAERMIEEVDANGDGFINLQEFMELHRDHMQVMAQDELKATFEMFDLNKDGHITAQELHVVLSNLGNDEHTSLEDCNRMIYRVDRKGAGHVDLDDFKLMMMHT